MGRYNLIIVTVPAHNESKNLKKCVKSLIEEMDKLNEKFIIIIAEDGSIDGTHKVAKKINHSDPRVKIFHSKQKLGRGLALKRAWKNINGEIFLFIDADLATDMSYFPKLINLIREGYDLVTG